MRNGPQASDETRNLHTRVLPAAAWSGVEPTWRNLFEQAEKRSFFTSPAWVGTWLDTFGDALSAHILLVDGPDGTVAGAIVADRQRSLPRSPLHRVYFHTAGEAPADSPVAEHADIVAAATMREAALNSVSAYLVSQQWDEFILNGATESAYAALSRVADPEQTAVEWRPTYVVDLDELRRNSKPYESALSASMRSQVRRSLRMYGERGSVSLHGATTTSDALDLFEQLVSTNLERRRHELSVFASDRWLSFHRALITRAFPTGAVQLLAARAGNETIGILYNFIDRKTISFYQSAFAFDADNRLKPGHVTHLLAIEAALRDGFDVYDFLAADGPQGSRYKASMSMRTERLAWAVIRRRTLPGIIVAAARRARARLR